MPRASESAGVVRRAHVVLWSADGVAGQEIAERLRLTPEAVSRIRRRFLDSAVAGLQTRPKSGRKDHAVPPAPVERVIELAMSLPPPGRTRQTTRLVGKAVGLSGGCISDLLRRHDIKPHLVRTYKVSRDPAFVAKVQDVVGLYLTPPQHAVVLSVDEKTSIQALKRTQQPPPQRTGRAARHTHDYNRQGVADLYAALEVATDKVTHRLSARHTAADFLAFMHRIVRQYPGRELHVILDNSSSHVTPEVKSWLAEHPQVHCHYTPTSASWLNRVEGCFGSVGKQSLSVTNFPSTRALREHLSAFTRGWNRNPTPFAWTKPSRAIIRSHRRMFDRISTAVH